MSDEKPASPNQPTVQLPPEVASGAVPPGVDRTVPPPGGEPLRPTAIEERFIAEAIKRGMVTPGQVRAALESPSGPKKVTDRLVKRGLIQDGEARKLEDEVTRTIVPGYSVLGELGRGGMGVVYKAQQSRLDRLVALKVVTPEAAGDMEFVRRFEQEAKALGRLNHPNIVQVYECGEFEGRLFIALEFVDGRDCSRELDAEGPFPREKALQVIRDAALGLRQAHRSGIIHRDVKPGNVLLVRGSGGELTAKIADLGLALMSSGASTGRLTRAGTVMGSPAYMAPEQSRAEAADHRSDIYGLGATLYHLLGGVTPFAAEGGSVLTILARKLTEQLDPPKLLAGDLDEPLLRVLDRMLARRPEDRYQTWDDAVADLEALIAGRDPRATRVDREHSSLKLGSVTSGGRSTGRPAGAAAATTVAQPGQAAAAAPRSSPLPLVIGAGALLLAGAAALLFLPRTPPTPPTPPGGQGTKGPSIDELTAEDVARGIEGLEKLAPGLRLSDEGAIAALQSKLGMLTPGQQITWRPRLKATLDEAVKTTEPERMAALESAWARGEWSDLDRGARKALADYARWERDAPARLRELAGFGEQAAREGAGAAERAAWNAAQATKEPLVLLELLDGFEQRFPFSPVASRAVELRRSAEEGAPPLSVESTPPGATLREGERELGPTPWKGRLLRGPHRLRVEAKNHVPLDLEVDLQGPLTRSVVLGPLPAKPLKRHPESALPVVKGPRYTPGWTTDKGETKGQDGLWLAATPGWASAHRDLGELLRRLEQSGPPWSVQWQVRRGAVPEGAQPVSAEVRVCAAEDGRSAVLGCRGDLVYLGLRGPAEDQLEVRYQVRQPEPGYFQLDWDGEVLDARTKSGRVGTIRLPWKPAGEAIQVAVQGGEAAFHDMDVRPMVE